MEGFGSADKNTPTNSTGCTWKNQNGINEKLKSRSQMLRKHKLKMRSISPKIKVTSPNQKI